MNEFSTKDDLRSVIDNDLEYHRMRDLADLLWNAMHDWPTQDQIVLSDFIKELYAYYGFPLTKDKIEEKRLGVNNDYHAQRIESGASIAEMIDISTRLENEPDLDKILDRIMNYYKTKRTLWEQ